MSEVYCPLGSTRKQFLALGKKKVGPPGECDKSPHTLLTAERPVSSGEEFRRAATLSCDVCPRVNSARLVTDTNLSSRKVDAFRAPAVIPAYYPDWLIHHVFMQDRACLHVVPKRLDKS